MRGRSCVAVLGYTVVLISFDRYAVADLAPLAVLPLALLWFARVPVWFALRRVADPQPVHSHAGADEPDLRPRPAGRDVRSLALHRQRRLAHGGRHRASSSPWACWR